MQTAIDPLTGQTVLVRPLRREEIPALSQAIEEVSEAQLRNRWQEMEMGFRELLVAELEGEMVGTVSINDTLARPNAMHLFALEVAPAVRGRGIGGAIVNFVVEETRRRGLRRVYLEVRSDNPARRLYHRLGFRRVGAAFLNSWWRFNDDGTRDRIEERSFRMFRRV